MPPPSARVDPLSARQTRHASTARLYCIPADDLASSHGAGFERIALISATDTDSDAPTVGHQSRDTLPLPAPEPGSFPTQVEEVDAVQGDLVETELPPDVLFLAEPPINQIRPLPQDILEQAAQALQLEAARAAVLHPNLGTERVAFAPFAIDSTYTWDVTRFRFDAAFGLNRPDRAEYSSRLLNASPTLNMEHAAQVWPAGRHRL